MTENLIDKTIDASDNFATYYCEEDEVLVDDTDYLARQRALESNARSYPRRLPIALKLGRAFM
jgi:hypothetical protein